MQYRQEVLRAFGFDSLYDLILFSQTQARDYKKLVLVGQRGNPPPESLNIGSKEFRTKLYPDNQILINGYCKGLRQFTRNRSLNLQAIERDLNIPGIESLFLQESTSIGFFKGINLKKPPKNSILVNLEFRGYILGFILAYLREQNKILQISDVPRDDRTYDSFIER